MVFRFTEVEDLYYFIHFTDDSDFKNKTDSYNCPKAKGNISQSMYSWLYFKHLRNPFIASVYVGVLFWMAIILFQALGARLQKYISNGSKSTQSVQLRPCQAFGKMTLWFIILHFRDFILPYYTIESKSWAWILTETCITNLKNLI